jgi:predicted ATP-grasp superfamily ATP-dependent carboligase
MLIEFEGLPESLPELVDPVMLCAFEGWNDAGDAASGAVLHLEDVWSASQVAEFDPEDYYDFQVNRPEIVLEDGERSVAWPTTRISVARIPLATRDVVLVHGIEPSMRWRSFTTELLTVARDLGVEMVITLGALLADTPHTRPVPVSGTSSDSDLALKLGYEPSSYEGPTGIVGVLQDACATAGIPAVSLWAAVPHYLAQPPCPKATLALLARIEDLLDVPVPLGDLPDEARAWQIGVDELAGEDEEIAAYVAQLEEAVDTAELPEASGDAIAREFERYLRRRASEPPKSP